MKILLLCYFGASGGKFIANCLSFSHKVAFANFEIAKNILKNKELLEKSVLDTIPLRKNSSQWLKHEPGCWQLFGAGIHSAKKLSDNEINDLEQLGDVWLPLVAHTDEQITHYSELFKDHNMFKVLIDADIAFIDLAVTLKMPNKNKETHLGRYPGWIDKMKLLNFDLVIDNWNPLIPKNYSNIVNLGKYLGVDFDMSLAKKYTEKYINFHIN